MLFRPTRTVRVTTEQELDSALASADQVIVEGNDKLLSYAAAKALRDPDNHIALEVGQRTVSVTAGPRAAPAAAPRAAPPPGKPAEAARLTLPAIGLGICVVAAIGFFLLTRKVEQPGTVPVTPPISQVAPVPPAAVEARHPAEAERPEPPVAPKPAPAQPPVTASTTLPDLAALAWPAVAVIAILALYLIARQAIAANRNVEITWKVTEKVAGRLVISKVRADTARKRAAA